MGLRSASSAIGGKKEGKEKASKTAIKQTLPMEDVNFFDNELDVG